MDHSKHLNEPHQHTSDMARAYVDNDRILSRQYIYTIPIQEENGLRFVSRLMITNETNLDLQFSPGGEIIGTPPNLKTTDVQSTIDHSTHISKSHQHESYMARTYVDNERIQSRQYLYTIPIREENGLRFVSRLMITNETKPDLRSTSGTSMRQSRDDRAPENNIDWPIKHHSMRDRPGLHHTAKCQDIGHLKEAECAICIEVKMVWQRLCCQVNVCLRCLDTYLTGKVDSGVTDIQCPGSTCKKLVSKAVISRTISTAKNKRFEFLCIKHGKYNKKRACPMCNQVQTFEKQGIDQLRMMPNIRCPSCKKNWCFNCVVPWHRNMNCDEYTESDTGIRKWAEGGRFGKRKAQKCPGCGVWIERTAGCRKMTCGRCNTSFCYMCGKMQCICSTVNHHEAACCRDVGCCSCRTLISILWSIIMVSFCLLPFIVSLALIIYSSIV